MRTQVIFFFDLFIFLFFCFFFLFGFSLWINRAGRWLVGVLSDTTAILQVIFIVVEKHEHRTRQTRKSKRKSKEKKKEKKKKKKINQSIEKE